MRVDMVDLKNVVVDDSLYKVKPARPKQKRAPKYMLRTAAVQLSPVPQHDSPDKEDDQGKQVEQSVAHDLVRAVCIHVHTMPLKQLMKNDAVDHGDDTDAEQERPPKLFSVFHF